MSDSKPKPEIKSPTGLKPILKTTPSNSHGIENTTERKQSTSKNIKVNINSPKNEREDDGSKFASQLTVPSFFGVGRKNSDGSNIPDSSRSSINSNLSPHSGRQVRFLDRLSWLSISALDLTHMPAEGDFMDGTRSPPKNEWDYFKDDPNYLAGFVDLFNTHEVTVKEAPCCVNTMNSTFFIFDTEGKVIYDVEKHVDSTTAAIAKKLCFHTFDIMRIGYHISIYNATMNRKLVTFIRKTHWFAEQLDIVETFYSLDGEHMGRIEKTNEGYHLVDSRGVVVFVIVRDINKDYKFSVTKQPLYVIDPVARKMVAKIMITKRNILGQLCVMCTPTVKHLIQWTEEIGVIAKAMILGVLFLELHSKESFVDLPLGRDAVTSRYYH